ncbi:metallophosphoesterase [Sagittula sp. NFXS13]|uniref:metallophosphoesterase n=1 Tax=Sagittula sp. NFXS13 TaxID=2819095 RepID=UPI0032E02FA9
MKLLNKILGRKGHPTAPSRKAEASIPFTAQIEPDAPFFAIGDVHGCIRQLGDLLVKIEKLEDVPQVICVGDLVDRGDDSAAVLNMLRRLNGEFGDLVLSLKGNHEAMMLDFIDDPERSGDRWLRNGGLQTLSSYRVSRSSGTSLIALRDRLVEAMGQDMVDWVRALPVKWQSGNVAVVHAGADPLVPMNLQSDELLLWGTSDFTKIPRPDGTWIVHGHTIVREPKAENGRISTDTGAYATGRLTCAYVRTGDVSFIEAT